MIFTIHHWFFKRHTTLSTFCFIFLVVFTHNIQTYHLPAVNLGVSNILDGGPVRPSPGWYWLEFAEYYQTKKFVDARGNLLNGIPSPHISYWAIANELVYQANQKLICNADWGVAAEIPILLSSHLSHNTFKLKKDGLGFGDFSLGIYLQWEPYIHHGRHLFVHRLEFDVTFPTGKNNQPGKNINPGDNIYFIEPYWAATLYMTPKFTASWRIYYLWCAKNHATHIQAGQATHLNYSFAYEIIPNFYIALNGYFLKQLTDDKKCGHKVPNSKEQVHGIGPGLAYFATKDFVAFAHFYGETSVRNRAQGIRFACNFVKHF